MKRAIVYCIVLLSVIACNKVEVPEEVSQEEIRAMIFEEMQDQGLTNFEDIEAFNAGASVSLDELSVERTVTYVDSLGAYKTDLVITVKSDSVQDISVVEYIPKEVAVSVSEIEFATSPTTVIMDDPLIMWHLGKAKKKVRFSYLTNNKNDDKGSTVILSNDIDDSNASLTAPDISSYTIDISTTSLDIEFTVEQHGTEVEELGVYYGTDQFPENNGDYKKFGSAAGTHSAVIDGLTPGEIYTILFYIEDNTFGDVDAKRMIVRTMEEAGKDDVIDVDGNAYPTVKIGDQVWMAENLRTTHYSDGRAIPLIESDEDWAALEDITTADAHSFNTDKDPKYGAYYTWAAAMGGNAVSSETNPSNVQGVCPDDWHLPSHAEWQQLISYTIANGYNYDGSTSGDKSASSMAATYGWAESADPGDVGNDQESNNATGFSILPAGSRHSEAGVFYNQGAYTYFWSSTTINETAAWNYFMIYNYRGFYWSGVAYSAGFSVRCVKD